MHRATRQSTQSTQYLSHLMLMKFWKVCDTAMKLLAEHCAQSEYPGCPDVLRALICDGALSKYKEQNHGPSETTCGSLRSFGSGFGLEMHTYPGATSEQAQWTVQYKVQQGNILSRAIAAEPGFRG